MYKFKKGDRVKLLKSSEFYGQSKGTIGTVQATRFVIHLDENWCNVEWDYGYKNSYPAEDLKLISKFKYMASIVETAKSMLLSSTERKLRKAGLKDECGFTGDAREIVMIKLCEENEEHLLEVAKASEADKKTE